MGFKMDVGPESTPLDMAMPGTYWTLGALSVDYTNRHAEARFDGYTSEEKYRAVPRKGLIGSRVFSVGAERFDVYFAKGVDQFKGAYRLAMDDRSIGVAPVPVVTTETLADGSTRETTKMVTPENVGFFATAAPV